MNRLTTALLVSVTIFCGCVSKNFTDLGNGVGVPSRSIDDSAEASGIPRDEARQQMMDESNMRRAAETAER